MESIIALHCATPSQKNGRPGTTTCATGMCGDTFLRNSHHVQCTIKGNVAPLKEMLLYIEGLFLELPSSHVIISTVYTFLSLY